jgi:hypothetical protein
MLMAILQLPVAVAMPAGPTGAEFGNVQGELLSPWLRSRTIRQYIRSVIRATLRGTSSTSAPRRGYTRSGSTRPLGEEAGARRDTSGPKTFWKAMLHIKLVRRRERRLRRRHWAGEHLVELGLARSALRRRNIRRLQAQEEQARAAAPSTERHSFPWAPRAQDLATTGPFRGAPSATTSVPIASSASPAAGFAVPNASSAGERWPRRGRPRCMCPCGCNRQPSRRFHCRLGDRGCGALIGPGCCAHPAGVIGRDDGLCCHCAEPNPQEPAVALA